MGLNVWVFMLRKHNHTHLFMSRGTVCLPISRALARTGALSFIILHSFYFFFILLFLMLHIFSAEELIEALMCSDFPPSRRLIVFAKTKDMRLVMLLS